MPRTTGFPREQVQFITTEFDLGLEIIGIIIGLIFCEIGLSNYMEVVEE